MRRLTLLYFLFIAAGIFFLVFSICAASLSNSSSTSPNVLLLSIKGAIGPATQDFIHRGLAQSIRQKSSAIILQLDTPGGLSESMRGINEDIISSPIPIISYVAPSGARAASAGTYILYASHIAAMAPGTNLGAATPINLGLPNEESEPAGAKTDQKNKNFSTSELKEINDAKAYIRSLAQLRGRNVEWAEQAVSQAASLSATEALKIHVIDLIADNISDLLAKVDGMKVTVNGKPQILHTAGLTVQRFNADWKTRFLSVITDPEIAYILLIIGFYGLLFEFFNPGFVLPGVVGAVCLFVALYALQLLPINYAGLILILLGLGFLAGEIFITSGVLGIGGIISFVIGSILLLKTGTGLAIPLKLILAVALVSVIFVIGFLQLAIRSQRRKVVSGLETMVGKEGIIIKAGDHTWVQVEGELWHVESEQSLQEGDTVRVESVRGLILKVKKDPSK